MIEKPYDSWMCAEPRRRNHTIGAKWLRQGSLAPVDNLVADASNKEGDGKSVIAGGKGT